MRSLRRERRRPQAPQIPREPQVLRDRMRQRLLSVSRKLAAGRMAPKQSRQVRERRDSPTRFRRRRRLSPLQRFRSPFRSRPRRRLRSSRKFTVLNRHAGLRSHRHRRHRVRLRK